MHTKTKSWADLGEGGRMDRPWLHRFWEKWAAASIAPSGNALIGAALLNYLPERPSRMFSSLVAQEGLSFHPTEVQPVIDGVRAKSLHKDYFWLGDIKYLVTSMHEHFYCARRVNTSNPDGEGAIIACIPAFIVITIYEGSIGAATKAMAATELLTESLCQRNF